MRKAFAADIKFNCDLSDASHWGSFSLCGLLMRYRDLYRSEKGLAPWEPIPRDEIAAWIQQKESQWPGLEGRAFRPLELGEASYDPFDSAGINEALAPDRLVYGAGYGMYFKPTFFLARIRSAEDAEGHRVYTADRELVRDLFTAPAMLQGRTIVLRLESLQALLWDKFSSLRTGCNPALEDAFSASGMTPGLPGDHPVGPKLEAMAVQFSRILLHHELAESREAPASWKDILSSSGDRKTELFLRAVKDLAADTSDRGPLRHIIDSRDRTSLAAFVGLPEGFRRMLFPELREAYADFRSAPDWGRMEEVRRRGSERFQGMQDAVVALAETTEPGRLPDEMRKLADQHG